MELSWYNDDINDDIIGEIMTKFKSRVDIISWGLVCVRNFKVYTDYLQQRSRVSNRHPSYRSVNKKEIIDTITGCIYDNKISKEYFVAYNNLHRNVFLFPNQNYLRDVILYNDKTTDDVQRAMEKLLGIFNGREMVIKGDVPEILYALGYIGVDGRFINQMFLKLLPDLNLYNNNDAMIHNQCKLIINRLSWLKRRDFIRPEVSYNQLMKRMSDCWTQIRRGITIQGKPTWYFVFVG
jgi:hypothetical protein